MINELKTIDILETAIDKIDDGKIEDAKDDLQTLKDELQNDIKQNAKQNKTHEQSVKQAFCSTQL